MQKESSNFKNKTLKELRGRRYIHDTKIGWGKIGNHPENKKKRLENRTAEKIFNRKWRKSSRK